jgi:hypothetical protein
MLLSTSDFQKAFYYFSNAFKMNPEAPRTLEFAIRSLKILGEDTREEVYLKDLKRLLPQQ